MYWFFFKKEKPTTNPIEKSPSFNKTESTSIEPKEILVNEDGREYWLETRTIQIPRKTYIKGNITGKYRGEIIDQEEELHNSTIYSFQIYEAEVACHELGHAIGLGHSSDLAAIMWPSSRGGRGAVLGEDDKAGVLAMTSTRWHTLFKRAALNFRRNTENPSLTARRSF